MTMNFIYTYHMTKLTKTNSLYKLSLLLEYFDTCIGINILINIIYLFFKTLVSNYFLLSKHKLLNQNIYLFPTILSLQGYRTLLANSLIAMERSDEIYFVYIYTPVDVHFNLLTLTD